MTNEIIERAAKALWENNQAQPYVRYGLSNQLLFGKLKGEVVTWEEINSNDVVSCFADEYREMAKIVVKAMREPPDGYDKIVYYGDYADDVWREMLDKILE